MLKTNALEEEIGSGMLLCVPICSRFHISTTGFTNHLPFVKVTPVNIDHIVSHYNISRNYSNIKPITSHTNGIYILQNATLFKLMLVYYDKQVIACEYI